MKDFRTSVTKHSMNRRGFLKGTLAMGAGALSLAIASSETSGNIFSFFGAQPAAAAQLGSDMEILNYALTLEYLETAAYNTILDAGILSGRAQTYFQFFGAHEQAHVDALLQTIQQLGGTPVDKPTFDFSSVPTSPDEVVTFFQTVEDLGASAYLGAAPSIQSPDILNAAVSIHAVEAGHAAALADIVSPGSDLFAPSAFPAPRTPDEVLAVAGPFIQTNQPGMPNTGAGGGSRLIAPSQTSRGILTRNSGKPY